MRLTLNQASFLAFACAVVLAVVGAFIAADAVEKRTEYEVRRAMTLEGFDWIEVSPNGMQVHLAGIAPTESARYRALTLAGQIIAAEHVIDEMGVTPAKSIAPPKFSIELLRTPGGLSAIGLIPSAQNRADLLKTLEEAADGAHLTDLIETANYAIPDGWDTAVEFGLRVAQDLPRSKVSISPGLVMVEAIADSARQQEQIDTRLRRRAPDSLTLVLNIAAPRPAIAPFVLRAVLSDGEIVFDACSAETALDRSRLINAARATGTFGDLDCAIGLGAPSDAWAEAGEAAIQTLARLGDGSVTFSNADVSLLAAPDVDPELFERETTQLARALPAPYTLLARIQESQRREEGNDDQGLPEFQVIISPEGHLRVTGPLPDVLSQQAVESYLHSRFGLERVSNRIELAGDLPSGWPLRVLTGIEALSQLNHGIVSIEPAFIELRGMTGDPDARARITQLLGSKLGAGQYYDIDVTYLETLDPEANLPTPQECVDGINKILAEEKITFAPGSVTVEGASLQVVNRIAEAMKDCQDFPMEIGGHTDSQGREEMNQQLSQSRADAVLNALLARRVLTTNLTARGYGESEPIADNGTEEGREANRRIEFKLLVPPRPEEEASAEPEQPVAETAEFDETIVEDAEVEAPDVSSEGEASDAPAEPAEPPAQDAGETPPPGEPAAELTGPGSDAVLVARPTRADNSTTDNPETPSPTEAQDGQN